MIDRKSIEVKRTPKELRDYCVELKSSVQHNKAERDKGHLKKGDYKHHFDEMIPLSRFCQKYYGGRYVKVKPILGNQSYDAQVYKWIFPVERVELTFPHDGARQAVRNREVVKHGMSSMDVHGPGAELEKIKPIFQRTAKKKSEIDYLGAILVFFVDYLPPFEGYGHEKIYEEKIQELKATIQQYTYNARAVYLYDMASDKVHGIQEPTLLGKIVKQIMT